MQGALRAQQGPSPCWERAWLCAPLLPDQDVPGPGMSRYSGSSGSSGSIGLSWLNHQSPWCTGLPGRFAGRSSWSPQYSSGRKGRLFPLAGVVGGAGFGTFCAVNRFGAGAPGTCPSLRASSIHVCLFRATYCAPLYVPYARPAAASTIAASAAVTPSAARIAARPAAVVARATRASMRRRRGDSRPVGRQRGSRGRMWLNAGRRFGRAVTRGRAVERGSDGRRKSTIGARAVVSYSCPPMADFATQQILEEPRRSYPGDTIEKLRDHVWLARDIRARCLAWNRMMQSRARSTDSEFVRAERHRICSDNARRIGRCTARENEALAFIKRYMDQQRSFKRRPHVHLAAREAGGSRRWGPRYV